MNASEHLETWKHPKDYGGFSPDGDYLILSQHRDSGMLDRSNWRRICEDLHAEAYDGGSEYADERPTVYHFRASHWAVGWVEYLLVRHDAPQEVLDNAGEIICGLADYSIYDESDYSDLEYSEACTYWERMSVRDRYDAIKRTSCGASIFAARHDYLPQDDNGSLLEYLRD